MATCLSCICQTSAVMGMRSCTKLLGDPTTRSIAYVTFNADGQYLHIWYTYKPYF